MRVLISADSEGVTGITNTNELMFGRVHYEFMRTMMTDDVNAAIDGAFSGGATSVVVNDAHWTMTNVQIERLDPRFVNIKPSRFGTLERLLVAIDHCEAHGITMYGGGQTELGCGRRHIQVLASLFYAASPNDVAPREYNEGAPRPGLPRSPLPPPEAPGF